LLVQHSARPEFTVRWKWKVGDYLPHRRVMHRAAIQGDRPYH